MIGLSFLLLAFNVTALVVFAQDDEVPEPAAADAVEAAPVDAEEIAPEDLVNPASTNAVEAADVFGEPMTNEAGRCTEAAVAEGTCVQCLGRGPLVPGTNEAEAERKHSRDCYELRVAMWRQRLEGDVRDAQPLQDISSPPAVDTPANPFSSFPTNQPFSSGFPNLGNTGLATYPIFTDAPAVQSLLSSLSTQLNSLQQIAAVTGLAGRSDVQRVLQDVSGVLSVVSGQIQSGGLNISVSDSGITFGGVSSGGAVGTPANTNPVVPRTTPSPMLSGGGAGQIVGRDLTLVQPQTLAVLEYIASNVDHPLEVISAYRSPTYNEQVGGASHSQHTHGNAIDLSMIGLSTDQKIRLVEVVLSHPDVNGFGFYTLSQSIHFDTRPVRVGKGYWGTNYSYTGFDADAAAGYIEPEIVNLVYGWSGQ